ncbi:MAG: hypothetical protein WC852_06950 [Candidatus Nanoarchaeia archaeon]|jgi:hypothetical protein
MDLVEKIRQLGHQLELTSETDEDVFYEIIQEDAVVKAKEPLPCFPEGYEFLMRFEGENEPRVMKIEDIALFDRLNINDKVRLCCKREYSIVRDYVPPDFQNKRMVGEETVSYEFIKAELLEAAKAL